MDQIIFSLLPLLAFFLLWLIFIAKYSTNQSGVVSWQETLIMTGLSWSVYLAVMTELLSLFNRITSFSIVFIWIFTIIILGIVLWKYQLINLSWKALKSIFSFRNYDLYDYFILITIVISLIIMLVTGIMSPPNVHDETTYHMSRVMHWRQNQSVANFPTSMTWQLWHAPFSEFVQLHWFLLFRGDNLSALFQWISLVLIMVAVTGIGTFFQVNHKGKILSAVFIMTLPIIVLQSSGAKNDIVMGFFIASLIYFVVKSKNSQLSLSDKIMTCLAVALGLLTKGNYIFFAFPLLVWLLINIISSKQWREIIPFFVLGFLIIFFTNAGYWIRNFTTFDNPFGTESASYLMNERFGIDVMLSNLLRNIVIQINRIGFLTNIVLRGVEQIHSWMGLPLYDPGLTHGPREFFIHPTREEVVGNPVHFLLSFFIVIFLGIHIFKKGDRNLLKAFPLIIVAIAGVVIFTSVFRWQVWGNRYFIPYYIMFAPLIGLVFSKKFNKNFSLLIGLILIIAMINPLFNNYSRSFNWSKANRNSIWHRSRRGLRFANHEIYEGAIIDLSYLMDISGCRTYGLVIGGDSPEYLIWGTLIPDAFSYHIRHIAVQNQSAVHERLDFDPCGIIVFEGRHPDIAFEGDYVMAESWEIPPYVGRPLTLYLNTELILEDN